MKEQNTTGYLRKRSISAVILSAIFFACCYTANWWDFIGIWSVIFVLSILVILFWMFYQWIFEIALLIRDRKVLTRIHFVPISIVTIYWIIVVGGFLSILKR